MNQTQTKPGRQYFDELSIEQVEIPEGTNLTSGTAQMPFGVAKDFLSDRPLRGIRQNDEDEDDVRAAQEALRDPERMSHEDVRRELGLE
jgi:hypothetical protein